MARFTMPDGITTPKTDKYIAAWYEFAKPLEVVLGGKLHSFDPGICIILKDGTEAHFDNQVVHKLNAALTKDGKPC